MKRKEPLTVTMPNKKVVRKRSPNGIVYIYYTLRAYRNDKGKPTSDTVLIGKLAEDSISLIPNAHYHELFPKVPQIVAKSIIGSIRQSGTTDAFKALSEKLGLQDCLATAFPEDHSAIMTAAMYMAECGNVMAYIEDWLDVTDAPCRTLTSQDTSRLFTSIQHERRREFFKLWAAKHKEEGHIAYDVTSISTHSDVIE